MQIKSIYLINTDKIVLFPCPIIKSCSTLFYSTQTIFANDAIVFAPSH